MDGAAAHRVLGLAADAAAIASRSALLAGRRIEGAVDLDRASRPYRRASPRTRRSSSTGDSSCSRRHWLSSSSRMLPRLPSRVFSVITRASRRLSIGGLVTWLKFCRKKWCRPRYCVGQHGERRVVAHRADGLLGVLDHRMEDQLEILHACSRPRPGGGAAPPARSSRACRACERISVSITVMFLTQSPKSALRRELVHDLAVVVEPALREIDGDHLAGADAALLDDRRPRRSGPCRSRSRRSAARRR